MTGPVREIILTTAPLTPPPPAFSAAAGGVLDFYGVVRGHEDAASINGIDYEAYGEMAKHQLALLAEEACVKFPLLGLTLHHRIGFIAAAEPSLFLRVEAAHRGPAFDAAQWMIEELKRRVPIWKHPIAADGTPITASAADHFPSNEHHPVPADSSPDAVA